MEIRDFFHTFSCTRILWIGNHSLLRLTVKRGIADVICCILRLLHHCGSCTEMDVINSLTHRIFNAKWYFKILYWYFKL